MERAELAVRKRLAGVAAARGSVGARDAHCSQWTRRAVSKHTRTRPPVALTHNEASSQVLAAAAATAAASAPAPRLASSRGVARLLARLSPRCIVASSHRLVVLSARRLAVLLRATSSPNADRALAARARRSRVDMYGGHAEPPPLYAPNRQLYRPLSAAEYSAQRLR